MENHIHPYKRLLRNRSMPPTDTGLLCDPSSLICSESAPVSWIAVSPVSKPDCFLDVVLNSRKRLVERSPGIVFGVGRVNIA
jgi:hypothetical protein